MRYERLSDIARLAIRLQGLRGGMTIADIQREFDVSRRTAERLRDAVESAFGPLETVEGEGRQLRWRLQSPSLRQLVRVSNDELAELNMAAQSLQRAGLAERAEALNGLAAKLRAMAQPRSPNELDADLEILMNAEGLAMRAGPRPQLQDGVLALPAGGHQDRTGGGAALLRPVLEEAELAARSTLRRALRQPRVSGGHDGLGERRALVAVGERRRGAGGTIWTSARCRGRRWPG